MSSPKKNPKIVAKYPVRCVDYVYDDGNLKANPPKFPQAICKLEILRGPNAGQTRMYYGSLKEGGQKFTAPALLALGMTNDDVTAPVGLGSREAIAVERENLYPGAKNKTRIDFIDPVEAPKLKAANPPANPSAAASKFRALFKSLKPLSEGVAPTAEPAPTESPDLETDGAGDSSAPF